MEEFRFAPASNCGGLFRYNLRRSQAYAVLSAIPIANVFALKAVIADMKHKLSLDIFRKSDKTIVVKKRMN